MASASELLPLWVKLGEQSKQLHLVHRLKAHADRLDYWPGSEMHHVPTVLLCMHGHARLIYERDQKLDLHTGEAVIIAPGVFHQHEKVARHCFVMQQGLTPILSDFHLHSDQARFDGYIPLDRVYDTFHGIIQDATENNDAWVDGLRKVCLSDLHEHVETTKTIPRSFSKMFQHFVRYAYDGINANDVISASGLSRSRAYALWTKHYGMPLREAISQQRLYLAKLLLQTELSIENIAERCGFQSRQQMTRLFQHCEGHCPREWRALQHPHKK